MKTKASLAEGVALIASRNRQLEAGDKGPGVRKEAPVYLDFVGSALRFGLSGTASIVPLIFCNHS